MNRFLSFLGIAGAICLGAEIAQALTAKPNVAPVVKTAIADQTLYLATTDIVDVSGNFRDPDASAAVKVTTVLGPMNFTLDGETAPLTVANFLRYVDEDRYYVTDPTTNMLASVFFHRSVTDFVIQTGGFIGTENPNGSGNILATQVATLPAVHNEPVISNKRGTLAMAKLGSDPNSATSQWFINLKDNSHFNDANGNDVGLDVQNGGFTVFGRVAGSDMSVADAIAALPKVNVGSPFDSLPVRNYTAPNPVKIPNLISIPTIDRISPFTFTVASSNSTVATATASGTNILVNGKQVGTAHVTVTAHDLDGATVAQSFNVNIVAEPFRLRNISTRANFPVGNEDIIGGFIVRGGTSKRIAVRALGPSLHDRGIASPISDPTLELRNGDGDLIASNDNWGDGPDQQLITDLGLEPASAKESALIVRVPSSASNNSYTAVIRSGAGTPGVGLVEVYELDSGPPSAILNLSTRGEVGTGDNVMIGGVIIRGTDSKLTVVRAIGPSLTARGVPGALPNPTLELRDEQGTLVDSNDDWQTGAGAAQIESVGLAPEDPHESALIASLPSGQYTAVVAGIGNNATGVALVEIYKAE